MTPQETNQLLVQFAAPASPLWLLLLAPVAGFLGWWLYRRDLPTLGRRSRIGLMTLRCGLIVALVILAFRPNVVQRATLTYPGRVVFAIDDSRSMLARDDNMSDAAALRIARALTPGEDHNAPLKTAADQLAVVIGRLHEFELYSRNAERTGDEFWDRAGKAQQDLEQQWARFGETATAAKAVIDKLAPIAAPEFTATQTLATELRTGAAAFFVGERWPGHKAFDDYYRRADALLLRLLDLQSTLDRQRIAQGDQPLLDRANSIRARSRLDLTSAQLTSLLPALPRLLPTQGFESVSVVTGKRQTIDAAAIKLIAAHDGTTDLSTRLQSIADEPSEFPLSAIVLISDGQDVAHRPIGPVESALSRQQVPVLAVGAGESTEPTDLAIIDLVAPPIAVANRPVTFTAVLKSAIKQPAQTRLELTCDGKSVTTAQVDLTPSDRISVPMTFTPDQTGVFRYAVKIASPTGVTEVFPTENNSAEFVLNVRKDPVRVLLLDWKPRWETRFALNVLQRMPYVQLNAIIAITQNEQATPRGAQRGSWPESAATLDLYDLVVIGELPQDLLTGAEWNMLGTWAEKRGGTIAFLAPRNSQGNLNLPESARALLPITTLATPTTQPAELQRIEQLQLTTAGRRHPLTLGLADAIIQNANEEKSTSLAASLRPAAQPLLLGPSSEDPLISWQPIGRGKSLLIDSDRLWVALNPSTHRAHLQMFVEMVTWAIESASNAPDAAGSAPRLTIDRRRGIAEQGLQIWAQNVADGAIVEAVVDDKVIAESPLRATRAGAMLLRAELPQLPPRSVTVRLKTDPQNTTPTILLTTRDAELTALARNDAWLEHLASATGGEYRPLPQIERLLQSVEPKLRVERRERVWRLWDSPLVMSLIVIVLSIEWIWRKFVGLV